MIRQFLLVLGLLILVALNAEARTYIQCSGQASDRTVVNINGEASTLFMTTGVGDPDEVRVLKNLRLHNETETTFEYLTTDEEIQVTVPKNVVGTITNGFQVILTFIEPDFDYILSCFSNVFND